MSNLWSLHRQYEQLFRHTVKDIRRKRIALQCLTLRHFVFQPGRSLCSHNPCWGLTPSQLHCVIIKAHHNYAAPWPWLSEQSAWCKHCEKGNPCARRNSGTDDEDPSSSLSFLPLLPRKRFINSYKSLLLEASGRLDLGFSLLPSTEHVSAQVWLCFHCC